MKNTNQNESKIISQDILEMAVDGIVIIDRHGIILSFNPAAERLFGYQASEAIGQNVNILMPDPYHSAHDDYIERYLRTGESKFIGTGCEVLGQHKDGRSLQLDIAISETSIDEQPLFFGIIRDITHLKKSEIILVDSCTRLYQFFEASSEALVFHEKGIVLDINPAVTEIFGYKEEDVIGKNVIDFVVEESQQVAIALLEKPSNDVTDICIIHKDGSNIPTAIRGKIVSYAGKDVRVIGIQDISDIKTAEKALRYSEERIRAIVDTTVDGIVTITEKGNVQTFNPAAEKIFGYTKDEVIGKNVSMLMPETYHHEHDSYLSNYVQSGEAKIIGIGREVTGKRKDGSTFPMELAVGQTIIANKSMFTGIVRDITERKYYENKLKESEARLTFLFAQSPIVTYNCEAHGDFAATFISDNVKELFGYEPSAFTNDPSFWLNNIHPDDVDHVLEDIKILFDVGYHTHVYRFMLNDGSYVWVEDGLRLICDKEGKPQEIVGYWMNIDDRKQAESDLIQAKLMAEKANRAKSEFLSSMSHELRTPLNAILGFSQLQLLEENLTEDQKVNANEINRAGTHLLQLIGEILDLAKIEAGHIDVEMESLELTAVINDCIAFTESIAMRKSISIKFEQPECNEVFIHADQTRFKQVLLNLLSNAVKYNRDNGIINIFCSKGSEGSIRVSINDTGKGISKENLDSLFQPFNRLGAEFSDIEGTGIGLVITKQLIENMDGRIGVESVVGEGTTFWIELNLAAEDKSNKKHENTIADKPEVDASLALGVEKAHPGSILIAEDNATNQLIFKKQLAMLGYEVDIAIDGQKAWEQLQERDYDLLLTDIHMPNMNGYELVKNIRNMEKETSKHIPIIAITANAMEGEARRCLQSGMDAFISKPVDLVELEQALIKWMPKRVTEKTEVSLNENDIDNDQATDNNVDSNEVINISILKQMVGDDPDLHRELFEEFVVSTSDNIKKIQDAYSNRDAVEIVSSAHKLKSSSKAMGAVELSEVCQGLETAGKAENWKQIDNMVPQLDTLLTSITHYVNNKYKN